MKYAKLEIVLDNGERVYIEYSRRNDWEFDEYVKAADPKDMAMGLLDLMSVETNHANRLAVLSGRRVTLTKTVDPHSPPWSRK